MILLAGVELDCYLNLQEMMDEEEFVDEQESRGDEKGWRCRGLQGRPVGCTGMALGWCLQENGRRMDLQYRFRLQSRYLRGVNDEVFVSNYLLCRKILGLCELAPGLTCPRQGHKKEDSDLLDQTA